MSHWLVGLTLYILMVAAQYGDGTGYLVVAEAMGTAPCKLGSEIVLQKYTFALLRYVLKGDVRNANHYT